MNNVNDFVIEDGTLVKYVGAGGDVVIPSGVKKIGSDIFSWKWSLSDKITSVLIPEGVTAISHGAFSYSCELQKIQLPESLEIIEANAFSNCRKLQTVCLGDNLISIGNNAFAYCSSLEEIRIPPKVTRIGEGTFSGCRSLRSVQLGDGVETIGERAFCYCGRLAEINLSDRVKEIGACAFTHCNALADTDGNIKIRGHLYGTLQEHESLEVPETVEYIEPLCFQGKKLRSVSIPGSVQGIGEGAFLECQFLEMITFAEGLKSVGRYAFKECESLKSVVFPSTLSDLEGDDLFDNCISLEMVSLPEAVVDNINDTRWENTNFGVVIRRQERTSFCAYVAKQWDSVHRVFIKQGIWTDYDADLVNNGPRFKYKMHTRLMGMLGRLENPLDLTEEDRTLHIAFLTKNIKKILSFAELHSCPELIRAAFQLGVVDSKNRKTVLKFLTDSQVPEINCLAEELANADVVDAASKDNMQEAKERKAMAITEPRMTALLEEAVLSGDPQKAEAVMRRFGKIRFTARALAFAVRYSTDAVVKVLCEQGASFNCDFMDALERKKYDIPSYIPYEWYLFQNERNEDKVYTVVSPAQRTKNIQVLQGYAEQISLRSQALLYDAIVNDDAAVMEGFRKAGLWSLKQSQIDIVEGTVPYNRLYSEERSERDAFHSVILGKDTQKAVAVLTNIVSILQGSKIKLTKGSVREYDFSVDREVVMSHLFSHPLFETLVQNTNFLDLINKREAMYAMVNENNATGIVYALEAGWLSKPEDLQKLLDYTLKQEQVSPELKTLLMSKTEALPPQEEKDPFSIKPLTAAELRKIWSVKKMEDGTLMLTGYKGEALDVVIPSVIGKSTVAHLDEYTFSPRAPRLTAEQMEIRKNIQTVVVPGIIRELPDELFQGMALTYAVLEEGVEKVGAAAFSACKALNQVVLPESLQEIGNYAFADCVSLADMKLPSAVRRIGRYALRNCSNLKVTALPQTLEVLDSMFGGWTMESFVIPNHIHTLCDWAFDQCSQLKKIEIPESISVLPHGVFRNCGFETFTVPPHIQKIADYAFVNCKSLKQVTFTNENVQISDKAFMGCDSLADENGLVILNGVLQDYVDPDRRKLLQLPQSVSGIDNPDVMKKLPLITYTKKNTPEKPPALPDTLAVGQTVYFGRFPAKGYECQDLSWNVIAKENDMFLLITEKCICGVGRNGYPESNVLVQNGPWESSDLRRWLNQEFAQFVFTQEEYDRIAAVEQQNLPFKRTLQAGNPTVDKVFLLSEDQVNRYMGMPSARICKWSEYTTQQFEMRFREQGWWLTRTPGNEKGSPLAVYCWDGELFVYGRYNGIAMIRPAIWVK